MAILFHIYFSYMTLGLLMMRLEWAFRLFCSLGNSFSDTLDCVVGALCSLGGSSLVIVTINGLGISLTPISNPMYVFHVLRNTYMWMYSLYQIIISIF